MGMHYTHLLIPVARDSKPAPGEIRGFFDRLRELGVFAGAPSTYLAGAPVTANGLEKAIAKRKRDYDVTLAGALAPGFELGRPRSDERVKEAKIPNPFGGAPMDVLALDDPAADPERDTIHPESWSARVERTEHASIRCHVSVDPVPMWRFDHPWGAEIEVPGAGGVRFWIALRCFEKGEAPVFIRKLDLAHPSLVAAAEEAFASRFRQGCFWR